MSDSLAVHEFCVILVYGLIPLRFTSPRILSVPLLGGEAIFRIVLANSSTKSFTLYLNVPQLLRIVSTFALLVAEAILVLHFSGEVLFFHNSTEFRDISYLQ